MGYFVTAGHFMYVSSQFFENEECHKYQRNDISQVERYFLSTRRRRRLSVWAVFFRCIIQIIYFNDQLGHIHDVIFLIVFAEQQLWGTTFRH